MTNEKHSASLTVFATVALLATSLLPSAAMAQNAHGQHGSTGGVERWEAHLESSDRGEWQRPDHVVELLALSEGMRVADLGAGTGYFLGFLSAAVGRDGAVIGLDVDGELVDFMNQRAEREDWGNVEARQVATDDPGLERASVDRVLTVNTWHHISDRETYAGRLAEALADGGAIYVVDFTRESPHGPPVDHRLTPEQVISELEAGGLKAKLIEEELPHQYVIVAR